MTFDAKLAGEIGLAQGLEIQAVLIALFSTHPNPKALLATYERLKETHENYEPFSQISDEAWAYVGAMRERLLSVLRDRIGN